MSRSKPPPFSTYVGRQRRRSWPSTVVARSTSWPAARGHSPTAKNCLQMILCSPRLPPWTSPRSPRRRAGLQALAHPAGSGCSGCCAPRARPPPPRWPRRLGLNTGATSYHLRQLAQHGFIVEDDPARQRAATAGGGPRTSAPATDLAGRATPEDARTRCDAYLQAVAIATPSSSSAPSRSARFLPAGVARRGTTFSDWALRLTPARARALVEALARRPRARPRRRRQRRTRRRLRRSSQRLPAARPPDHRLRRRRVTRRAPRSTAG